MKIAIVERKGSFSDRWIEYCQQNGIPYKTVCPYSNDIMEQVADCTAFMWHHSHVNYKDVLFAKQLLYSLQQRGLHVFPDYNTTWHFDDKVGQKYLFEAVGAPLVPSHVFYTKRDAMNWIAGTDFPKVFKLRGGAGAHNVKLAHNASEARKYVRKAFGRGFPQFDRQDNFNEHLRKVREGKEGAIVGLAKGIAKLFIGSEYSRMHPRDKGYVYFQDFIPNNTYDIRIVVVGGDKAFYIKRMVRKGDFRASGSGHIIYEEDKFTKSCVKVAFEVERKIMSQCTAYDFVMKGETPLIVECSYGFSMHGYDSCEGYYTSDMEFHRGSFNPQAWMVQNLLKTEALDKTQQ